MQKFEEMDIEQLQITSYLELGHLGDLEILREVSFVPGHSTKWHYERGERPLNLIYRITYGESD